MHTDTNQFTHLKLSDDGFLFDASTGHNFNLNALGTFILNWMIQGWKRDQIITAMTEAYDPEEGVIHRDFSQLCKYL